MLFSLTTITLLNKLYIVTNSTICIKLLEDCFKQPGFLMNSLKTAWSTLSLKRCAQFDGLQRDQSQNFGARLKICGYHCNYNSNLFIRKSERRTYFESICCCIYQCCSVVWAVHLCSHHNSLVSLINCYTLFLRIQALLLYFYYLWRAWISQSEIRSHLTGLAC